MLLAFGTVSAAGAPAFAPPVNYAVGDQPISVAIADVNSDGDPDLAVSNLGSDSVSVLLGQTAAAFASPTTLPATGGPQGIAVSDFNDDSYADLAVAASTGDLVVFLGGPVGFGAPTRFPVGTAATRVAIGDFNGDSDEDVAVARNADSVAVLPGLAGRAFGPADVYPRRGERRHDCCGRL
jgi:hypothetical protein